MRAPEFIPWRRSDIGYLALAVVLVFVLAASITILYVVFSFVRVDGESMAPILRDEDRLLITRGYDDPRRGDIIAFDALTAEGEQVSLIKRVVAVGGDEIEVFGDIVYVNGELSEVAGRAIIGTESPHVAPATVPDGSVFVMGDNRPISLDSRFIGTVPLEQVTGRGRFIVWPITRLARIDAGGVGP